MEKKKHQHHADSTLGPLAHHYETQLNKQPNKQQQLFFGSFFFLIVKKYNFSGRKKYRERNREDGNININSRKKGEIHFKEYKRYCSLYDMDF